MVSRTRLFAAACAILLAVPAFGQLPLALDGQELPSLAPMIERTAPAVVNIAVRGSVQVSSPLMDDPFFRRFFGPQGRSPQQRRRFQSAGSGVIVDAKEGYILTNHHVVDNADEITITLLDNRSLTAEIVGSDSGSDIALLKVDADNLTELSLGDSDALRVGDFVVAIGNPFGLENTVTSGIVSAKGRSSRTRSDAYEDFIQTDASINPGNSGGALVNLRGELVGINSAIFTQSGGNIGIGFAIPVNMANSIMSQLLEFGSVRRGLLGVNIFPVTPDIAEDYGLERSSGALVTSVNPGSAAEKAGIAIDDVITSVNGREVEDASQLRNAIGILPPGERVRIGIVRDGRERTLTAKLDALQPQEEELDELDPAFEGAEFSTNDSSVADFNGTAGVLVTSVAEGSPAHQRGLRSGDVIVEVNRQRVRSLSQFSELVEAQKGTLILRVQRGDRGTLIMMR